MKSTAVASLKCTCNKSKCIKMYCECFTAGRFCDESCSCTNCHNKPEFEKMIREARKNIRNRNPLAFKAKDKNTGPYQIF